MTYFIPKLDIGTEQEAAFEKLKQELSSKTVMTYFIPKLDINIYVDASPVGLGGNTVTRKQDCGFCK
jgi:hypothetical protein